MESVEFGNIPAELGDFDDPFCVPEAEEAWAWANERDDDGFG